MPIVFLDGMKQIKFNIENRSANVHTTEIILLGLPNGLYAVSTDGKVASTIKIDARKEVTCEVLVPAGSKSVRVIIDRQG